MPVHFSSPIPKMSMFTFAIFCLTRSSLPWFMELNFGFLYNSFFTTSDFTLTTRQIHKQASFPLWPSHFIFSGAISNCPLLFPSEHTGHFLTWEAHLPVSYLFAFSYCPWGSQGKNIGVVCHSLFQWTTFCQNSSLWLVHLGWPWTAWLMASLSYTNPFATTRLWSMKGVFGYNHLEWSFCHAELERRNGFKCHRLSLFLSSFSEFS